MKRISLAVMLLSAIVMNIGAQKIDFDFPGRNTSEVTETN